MNSASRPRLDGEAKLGAHHQRLEVLARHAQRAPLMDQAAPAEPQLRVVHLAVWKPKGLGRWERRVAGRWATVKTTYSISLRSASSS